MNFNPLDLTAQPLNFGKGPSIFEKWWYPKKRQICFLQKKKKICQIWPRQTLKHFTAAFIGFPPCTLVSEERQGTAMYYLKCVRNLRARSDVSKNGVNKSNWIKNGRHMEHWKFLTFTNPSSDGDTHIQWSIMFHSLFYHQSSQIQFLSSDQPKLLSRFVIVDDHFIRNIIQHLTKIVDQLPHNPQFWKNSSWTQGLGKKAFFKGEKNPKTLP